MPSDSLRARAERVTRGWLVKELVPGSDVSEFELVGLIAAELRAVREEALEECLDWVVGGRRPIVNNNVQREELAAAIRALATPQEETGD